LEKRGGKMIKLLTLTALLCGVQTQTISVNCVKNLRTCLKGLQKHVKLVGEVDRVTSTPKEKKMLQCVKKSLESLQK
jgi:hypothetical protein